MSNLAIPIGLCQCGCGEKTSIAKADNAQYGHMKGQPVRFRPGHHGRLGPTLKERFWAKVDRRGADDCWEWTAARFKDSRYGLFHVKSGCPRGAHRVVWELVKGPIPPGACICHHCDNPPCVNPAHLWLGTVKQNAEDMARKGRAPAGGKPGEGPPPSAYEKLPRGDDHFLKRHPEASLKGMDQGSAKLTDDQVREIRSRAGTVTNKALANEFGVSNVQVGKIIRRISWRHIV